MPKTEKEKKVAEMQIQEKRKEISYDTRDYSIDFLMSKYHDGDFYIPDEYQRKYIWPEHDKVRLIESILLGLPIPFMFFADTEDGRCEIVDGAQRTQALEEFLDDNLTLVGLKKLDKLNGFTYSDIPNYYKTKIKKTNLRVVVLSDDTTLEIRQEIFNRINTAGVGAKSIEIRRGSYSGKFMNFMRECTENTTFKKVSPVTPTAKKRYEDLELVLRFFAFLNNYQNFKHGVDEFLDDYVEAVQDNFDEENFRTEFANMLNFVQTYFPFGLRKTKRAQSTPRVRFEALSVGVALALREKHDLTPSSIDWLDSEEFKRHTTTHASNSLPRVKGRIEYVKNSLLGENDG